MKKISKHWKTNFRKKSRKKKNKYASSSSESSSSSSDSDDSSADTKKERRTSRKKRDEYALNVNDTKQDTRNQYGVIKCGHCGKPGHSMANCWELHVKPENMGQIQ